ncbi:hypothetical protein [Ferrithrix thermotolerans]|uniref:hypothetical protein n=1 Tax=Ferrithrix thermotolerans TaxID=209649 RepID=UPI0009349D8F
MNLREWAFEQGIHPQTAYKWFRQGKLAVPATKMGKLILVGDLSSKFSKRTRIYGDLRLRIFC